MISRNSGGGFFAAHWDWVVAAVGLAALAGGAALFVTSGGEDPEERAAASVSSLMSGKRAETGVKPVEMAQYERTLQFAAKPTTLADVPEKEGSFLASAARVLCPFCKKPILAGSKTCSACGKEQPVQEKAVADADGDGLPDEWEKKYGLDTASNDADADKDGDGFTNAEEYAANTDPSDRESHPDYFDSLSLELPLKETLMPFYFVQVQELPGGRRRYQFRDPKARGDSGQRGRMYMPLQGEEIGNTGFVVKDYVRKSVKVALKAAAGDKPLETTKEVFIAKVERKSDGRMLELSTNERRTPLDIEATIAFSRGEPAKSVVVPGASITIYGKKYKVIDIKRAGKAAEVSIEDPSGKIRVLKALEQ